VPYYHIRISKGVWEPLHRNIWKKANGEIPPKHIVIFKDGNTLNCELDNLELISKDANARRNDNPKKRQATFKAKIDAGWDTGCKSLSESYVAGLITLRSDLDPKEIIEKYPELVILKRTQLQLNRLIKSKNQKNNECN
jgi:hypothetical protein